MLKPNNGIPRKESPQTMTREDIAKLSDEEANAQMAVALGWTDVKFDYLYPDRAYNSNTESKERIGIPPINQHLPKEASFWKIPSYCSDLDVMHEAEKTLTDDQRVHFRLRLMFNSDGPKAVYRTVEAALCHATPRERAEAFLATTGKDIQ